MRRKSDFDAVYARGRRTGGEFFVVIARTNAAGGPRLGLSVAAKAVGNAVQRNRIRRLVRESFRHRQRELPACDLVVSARARARGVPSGELRASLEALWDKVKEQCTASPPG